MNLQRYLDSIHFRCTDVWPQLAGKSVFIAGDTGFFGQWFRLVFDDLRERGIDVRFNGGSRRSGWDITDARTFGLLQTQADYVINCAGSARGGDKAQLINEHVIGPVNLANHLKDGATLLQFSSGAAKHGKTPYAGAKIAAEHHLRAMGRPLQIVRPFAVIGPLMDIEGPFAISTFIRNAKAGLPLEFQPGIERSFCHIADLIVQCLHVMVSGDGQPYEVGSNDLVSMEEAARRISDHVGATSAEFSTNAGVDSYGADLTRINQQFNLSLEWNSLGAVSDTWHYYRNL